MGVQIEKMHSYFEFKKGKKLVEQPRQVLALAIQAIKPIIDSGLPSNISHLILATTCPDMLSPSLGQLLKEEYIDLFSDCHSIDIVQGCAGGVSAMILASQLSKLNKSSVIVVQADAANKATSSSKRIHKIFGNGAFSCLISYDDSVKDMIYSKSKQYKGLAEVVTVKLGHDADEIIMNKKTNILKDPRKYLGLSMDNSQAIKLFRNAEEFYLEFVKESMSPDVMILHQVNPLIIRHLKSVFSKYNLEFVDVSELTGNCGAASVGIALDKVKHTIQGKKVLLCSFGTGGVITAGLWQN